MKFKNIVIVIFIFISIVIVFRSWLYQKTFHYKTIGFRNEYLITDKELAEYIDVHTIEFKPTKVEDIIELALELTSEKLEYRMVQTDNNPNTLVRTKRAHCVGYSGFFSSVCNYLLVKYGYTNWRSKPLIGNIYFLGINLHSCFSSPFFKDHDFNSIENQKSNQQLYTDPTMNDYFCIKYVEGSEIK